MNNETLYQALLSIPTSPISDLNTNIGILRDLLTDLGLVKEAEELTKHLLLLSTKPFSDRLYLEEITLRREIYPDRVVVLMLYTIDKALWIELPPATRNPHKYQLHLSVYTSSPRIYRSVFTDFETSSCTLCHELDQAVQSCAKHSCSAEQDS